MSEVWVKDLEEIRKEDLDEARWDARQEVREAIVAFSKEIEGILGEAEDFDRQELLGWVESMLDEATHDARAEV